MRKYPRTVFTIQPDASTNHMPPRWVTLVGGQVLNWSPGKQLLVAGARAIAKALNRDGYHAQIVVKGRNGRIQTEHTYGADPRRTKG